MLARSEMRVQNGVKQGGAGQVEMRENEGVRRANEGIYARYTPFALPFVKQEANHLLRVGLGWGEVDWGEAGWGPGESRRVVTAALKNVLRNQCEICQAAVKAQLKLDNTNL